MSNPTGPASSGASETTPLRLAIIGCGNPTRSDDGVGVEVVQRLMAGTVPTGVAVIDAGTAGMDVMFRVRGAQHVVIVDACRSGGEPGAIFRLPGREAMTPTEHGFTLHGLRWDHALYAGCKMFGESFADHTEVILIEAGSLDFGLSLSPPVQAAAERVTQLLTPLLAAPIGCVEVRAGRLHLPGDVYERALPGCPALALLVRDGQWWLLPLKGGAGGLQIKIRNARGDRVVEAQEFFRAQGVQDDDAPCAYELQHVPEAGGFRLLAQR